MFLIFFKLHLLGIIFLSLSSLLSFFSFPLSTSLLSPIIFWFFYCAEVQYQKPPQIYDPVIFSLHFSLSLFLFILLPELNALFSKQIRLIFGQVISSIFIFFLLFSILFLLLIVFHLTWVLFHTQIVMIKYF